MASYAISASSTYSKSPLLTTNHVPTQKLRQVTRKLQLAYYRYEVTFGLYVMTPAEKMVANGFVLCVLALLVAACLFYMPDLAVRSLKRVSWYFLGDQPSSADQLTSLSSLTVDGARFAVAMAHNVNNTIRGEL